MKTALIAALASTILLAGCVVEVDSEQTAANQTGDAAPNDPVVSRLMQDFPEGRFVYVRTPAPVHILLDRKTGCIYKSSDGTAILNANGQPDCNYKS